MEKKKRKRSLIRSGNGLIAELADVKWIKQPIVYSLISGDFSLMQMNVIVALSQSLQERIDEYLRKKHNKSKDVEPSLFSQEETNQKAITFTIPLSSLCIKPKDYGELEDACAKLSTMSISYPRYEKGSKSYQRVYANLFSRIVLPTEEGEYSYKGGKRRSGTVEITMLTENLKDVFDMSHGYVNHISSIAQLCKRKRTPRIYIYLERWRNCKTKTVNFIEFKEYLGLLHYNRKTQALEDDMYPEYWYFCMRVLDPVKKELDELSKQNKVDLSFDYEPIYFNGRKRGNPDEIKFTILLSDMGKNFVSIQQNKKGLSDVLAHLKKEYDFTDKDLFFLSEDWRDELLPDLEEEIIKLKEKEERYKPNNPSGYAMACLKKFMELHKLPSIEEAEVIAEPEAKDIPEQEPVLSSEDLLLFAHVTELMNKQSDFAYTNIFKFIKLLSVDRRQPNHPKLRFAVPSKFFYDEIEGNHLELFRESLYQYFPGAEVIGYDIDQKHFKN